MLLGSAATLGAILASAAVVGIGYLAYCLYEAHCQQARIEERQLAALKGQQFLVVIRASNESDPQHETAKAVETAIINQLREANAEVSYLNDKEANDLWENRTTLPVNAKLITGTSQYQHGGIQLSFQLVGNGSNIIVADSLWVSCSEYMLAQRVVRVIARALTKEGEAP